MKKLLLVASLALGTLGYAQTYCIPYTSYGCDDGDMIDSFSIPSINFNHANTGCSTNQYGDYTSMTISLGRGANHAYEITHDYTLQKVKIWVDFNNDGIFNDFGDELVSSASSVNYSTNGIISIPGTVALGNYRMRVGDLFSSDPVPCNDDGYGEFHDYTLNVIPGPTCTAPSNVVANNVTPYTASLNWTASSSNPTNGYEYYYSTSPTSPTPTTAATNSVGANITTANLSSLSAATTYYAWVRAVCSATDKSAWSLVGNFTTLCATVTPTYTTDFSNFLPACWEQASGGTPATGPTGTDSIWIQDDFLYNGPSSSARINLYYYDRTGWLKTVPFDLSGGTYQLKFDYGITDYYSDDPSPMGSDDVVNLLVSTNGGSSWTILKTWTAANAPSNVSTTETIDLSSYNGNNVIFAFYGTDGTSYDNYDYNFYVTNFKVEPLVLSTSEVAAKKDNIQAYPNPFTDYITLTKIDSIQSLNVTDASGKLIKSYDKVTPTVDLRGLQTGLYYINLITKDGGKQNIKVIKK